MGAVSLRVIITGVGVYNVAGGIGMVGEPGVNQ